MLHRMPVVRKSLNLLPADRSVLEPFLDGATPEHEALIAVAGEEAGHSESAALRALAILGARAVIEAMLERGYTALSEAETTQDREEKASLLGLSAVALAERSR